MDRYSIIRAQIIQFPLMLAFLALECSEWPPVDRAQKSAQLSPLLPLLQLDITPPAVHAMPKDGCELG